MPTYQYRCTECGHNLEAVQAFSDAPLDSCPECGGKLRKQYGSVGVVFKGSGFYRTDSRAGADAPAKPAAGATPSGGASDGGSSTSAAGTAATSAPKPSAGGSGAGASGAKSTTTAA